MIRLCALLVWLLAGAAGAQTQVERDRSYLAGLIEDSLSGGARIVQIDGFAGALSSRATITRMTIADSAGVWLVAEGLVLDWSRAALISGRLQVAELSAARVRLDRLPQADPATPRPEAVPFALPDLPVSVDIGRLAVADLNLGPGIIGTQARLAVAGSLLLAGGIGVAELTADRIDGPPGAFGLAVAYTGATGVLSLTLDLVEGPGGLAATMLDLPGAPSVSLALGGSGPVTDWTANLRLSTDSVARVRGEVNFGLDGTDRIFGADLQGDLTPLLPVAYHPFFGTDAHLIAAGRRGVDGIVDLTSVDIAARSLFLGGSARVAADGWPLALDLSGVLGAPGGGALVLPVAGGQTQVDGATLTIRQDAGDESLSVDIAAQGFQRPGVRIANLTLAGGGALVPRRGDVPGRFDLNLTYGAAGLTLDDPGLAQALGADISGGLRLARDADGPLRVVLDRLTGPGLTADADLTVDAGTGDGPVVAGRVDLSADDLGRFAGLTGLALTGGADLTADLTYVPLTGAADVGLAGATRDLGAGIGQIDPYLAGAGTIAARLVRDLDGARVEGLDVRTALLTVTGRATAQTGGARADLDLTLADLSPLAPVLDGPLRFQGTVTTDPDGLLAQGGVTLTGATATVTYDRPVSGRPAVLGQARVPDLAVFAGLAGLPLRGAVTVDLAGEVPGLDGLDLTLSAATTGLAVGLAPVDAVIGGAGTLGLRLRGDGSTITASDATLITPGLTATATGQLQDGAVTVELSARLNTLADVVPGLTGGAGLTGRIVRQADGTLLPVLMLSAMGADATVGGRLPPDGPFDGTIAVAAADTGTLAPLTGLAVRGPLSVTATGLVATDLSLIDLSLSGLSQSLITGIPQVDAVLAGAGSVTARLRGTGPDALSLDDLILTTPALRLTGSAAMAEGDLRADLITELADLGLIAPGLTGAAAVDLGLHREADGQGRVDIAATMPGGTATLGADLAVDLTATGAIAIDIADLTPWGRFFGQPLSGALAGRVSGTVTSDGRTFDLTVDARATNVNPGNVTVATLLRGTGTLQGRLSASAEGRGIRVRDLQLSFPNLTASGDLSGAGGIGTARFQARLADVALFAPDFSGPLGLTGSAARSGGGDWQVDVQADGPGGSAATIAGRVGAAGQLALTVNGQVPLGLINGLVEPRRLSGMADLSLTVNGPPALQSVAGTVRLAGARLSDPGLGALSDIGGTIALAGGRAVVDLSGGLDAGGSLRASGGLSLTAPYPADLAVDLTGLVLRDPALYETTADGRITLTGPLAGGARVAGLIALGRTEVQVPSSGVGSFGDLPTVVHVNPSAAVRATLARAGLTESGQTVAGGGGAAFPLDLTLSAPSRVFIRGRGLDAELGGSLRLTGTTANVIPSGQFSLVRGRLDILQQRFTLTEGSATLQGNFIPVLRLVATTRARTGTEIDITVQGPANAPQVIFTSRPELPQDEVLAQLLFGRDLSSISPLQAVQLAAAVGTLAGRGGGGVIAGLREGIGVDDFDVTADDQGNAAVRLGAYIGENVYTDVTVGTQETEVNINLDLTPDITARGSVSTDGETSIGIYFERDY